jgi:hypothetical protein
MEFKMEVVYVSAKEFKSKAGKDCKVIEILEVDKKSNQGSCVSFFVANMPSIVSNLKCGDVIEVVFDIKSAGGRPALKDITKKVFDSPYFTK